MKILKNLFFLFLLLPCSIIIYAQNASDSLYRQAVNIYTDAAGVNAHLYNGSEYIDYDHRITGNPFFASLYFTDGSVIYDGIEYNNVQFFYDILNDDVVIKNYNGSPLILVKEKVSAFTLNSHHFIKLDSLSNGIKGLGFYEVLYDGNNKLVAKRKKSIVEKISTQYSESYFSEHDEYFILKDGKYNSVGDKRSALMLLHEHKKELIKFMHQHKINYRRDGEAALTKLVAYYDSLNKTK